MHSRVGQPDAEKAPGMRLRSIKAVQSTGTYHMPAVLPSKLAVHLRGKVRGTGL